MSLAEEECATAHRLDDDLVAHWLERRNDVSALAPLWECAASWSTPSKSRAAGASWSTLYERVSAALREREGMLVVSVHQSHAYLDGACLYFTFAGQPESDADAFYREAWDRAMDEVIALGAAISHHHGVGRSRARFVARSLGASYSLLEDLKSLLGPRRTIKPRCARPRRRAVVRALALDVGSSSVRTAVVDEQGAVTHVHQQPLVVRSPAPGEVELDALQIANVALELAAATLRDAGPCEVVGITNQRATTIVFDPLTGEPAGPALSWQDLRTVIDCLVLQERGLRLAPNQSATKVKWLLEHSGRRAHELRFATIETWIAWHLSRGSTYVSDHSNASVSGLVDIELTGWDQPTVDALGISEMGLPQLVSTIGSHGEASALPGSPTITALVGDQPASLFGQSCVRAGAKITFGTGAMLDMVHRAAPFDPLARYASGCYPTVVRSAGEHITWGVEGIILSAGTCVEWLRELGLFTDVADSERVANSVESTDGVSFVPAFSGLGTPRWDFGARGAFFGLTRGSSRGHLARAVLDGIAQRGADLLRRGRRRGGHRTRTAAGRRRDEHQSILRPAARGLLGARGRGLLRARSDDARCRTHGARRCRSPPRR